MRRNTIRMLLASIFLCSLLAACTAMQAIQALDNVPLRKYSPALSMDMSEYKGKRINLLNFDNQAGDTTNWDYFSSDKKYSYSTDSRTVIHNYFWHSFEKALKSIGMTVSNQRMMDVKAPAMWMTLKSITDARFEVEVNLQKIGSGTFFTRIYTITGDDIKQEERNRENLEKRAYRMTSKLFETILTDPEFKKAFFNATAEMAAPQNK
jgi:hypothetical protein